MRDRARTPIRTLDHDDLDDLGERLSPLASAAATLPGMGTSQLICAPPAPILASLISRSGIRTTRRWATRAQAGRGGATGHAGWHGAPWVAPAGLGGCEEVLKAWAEEVRAPSVVQAKCNKGCESPFVEGSHEAEG